MKKLIVLLVCCLFLIIGCSTEENNKSYNMPVENQIKTVPPPGYTILCDNQGHYGVKHHSGYVFQYYYDDNNEPPKTRQGAIDRAWGQYEFDHRAKEVPKKYDWRECKEK